MRAALILLFVFPVLFCQYADPPLHNVTDYNLEAAESLDGLYNASIAQNSTLILQFGSYSQTVPVSASMEIAGPSLMMDNATHPTDDLALILARGTSQGHLTSLSTEGYPDFICDADWFQQMTSEFSWRCDFDSDDCAEYEKAAYVVYDITANFSFGDVSETVDMESNVIEVPEDVLEAMSSASGADTLNLSLDGNVVFIYEINDRTYTTSDCGTNLYNRSVSIPISLNGSFTVCGDNKIFLLVAPPLREQWYGNNRFDVAVLSQSPLYEAGVYEEGNISRTISLRNFSITTDGYGLQRIISNLSQPSEDWIEGSSSVVKPIPLEMENNSFLYAYRFNHSYTGLGNHTLSLLVKDSFGGSQVYSERLVSVMLSYGNTTTENGSPIGAVPSRKSMPETQEYMARLDLSLGLVALLLLLAFVNSWLLR